MKDDLEPFAFAVMLCTSGVIAYTLFSTGQVPSWTVVTLFVSGLLAGTVVENLLFTVIPNVTLPGAMVGFAFLALHGLANFATPFGPVEAAVGTVAATALLSWTGFLLKCWFGPARQEATS